MTVGGGGKGKRSEAVSGRDGVVTRLVQGCPLVLITITQRLTYSPDIETFAISYSESEQANVVSLLAPRLCKLGMPETLRA